MPRTTRRYFLQSAAATGAAAVLPLRSLQAQSAAEQVNVGIIGCGWRGGEQTKTFGRLEGVKVAGLCDPDQARIDETKQNAAGAKTWTDLRGMLDDSDIDAVVVTTCNHWHALASVWAMQAGKHVYVEKPLAHNIWEGRQIVEAAKQTGRVCAIGTQQRADPMQLEIQAFLHDDRKLGAIKSVRANRFGVREPIGKRSQPLQIADSVDYNLWLGPASEEPLYRDQMHYDWHWVWNTGSGEMGNWGVHILDDVYYNVFQNRVKYPRTVIGGGGRVVWNDAGDTPNLHLASLDVDGIPVIIGLTNLRADPDAERPSSPKRPGPGSGYIVYCEGGRLEAQRGRAAAFDSAGAKLQDFPGNSGDGLNQQSFVDAVRAGDPSLLTAPVEHGHYSSAWCHLANIAVRAGNPVTDSVAEQLLSDAPELEPLAYEFSDLLERHGVDPHHTDSRISRRLAFDAASERFVGDGADGANQFISREFRDGFAVPEIARADS